MSDPEAKRVSGCRTHVQIDLLDGCSGVFATVDNINLDTRDGVRALCERVKFH